MMKTVLIALALLPISTTAIPTSAAEAAGVRVAVRAPAVRLVVRPTAVFGTRVAVVPRGYRTVRYRGTRYVAHGGIYYRPVDGRYQVVAAPTGLRLTVLPAGYQTFAVGQRTYYFHGGNYYRARRGGFVVVKRPRFAPTFTVTL